MWPQNTRIKQTRLSALTETAQNPRTWELPKSGILAGLFIRITGTIAGTISAPNALGMASIIRRVRLLANSGIALIDVSGPGYHYLLRDQFEQGFPAVQNNARDAVTATTYDVSMYFPISVNSRDPIGLFMLQNESTQLRLEVEFESNANIATGITTHTNTVQPNLVYFTVPVDPKSWPPFNFVQTMQEEAITVSAAGEITYNWPRGNTYISLFHGMGLSAASPADNWTQFRVRVNQSDYLLDWGTVEADMNWELFRNSVRELGIIPLDLMVTSGLGNYGSARDLFDSSKVTDIASIITASGAGTLYVMKRQLVNIG
jgi:hypothetical protein